jgi:Tol biopolymer transport system component
MSPEQVEGKELDGRSDVFSLGAVLYEMLTGQRAFEGKSQLSVASAILEKEPSPITSAKPMTPPVLDHAICRCLAKDPEDRWQSAPDLKAELEWLARVGAGSSSLPGLQIGASRALWMYASLVTIVALVLTSLMWHEWSKLPPTPAAIRFELPLPPTSPVALKSGSALAIAPDSRRLAYVVAHEGTTQLFLRDLSAFEGKLLPGTEGASAPFFSPDGEWIGFYAEGRLKKISVNGGPAITLCDAPEGNGATWLPDGTIVFSATWVEGLRRVAASGGTAELITHPDQRRGEAFHWWPDALPGGRAVLFTNQRGPGSSEASIAALSLRNGEWRTVLEKGSNPHYVPSAKIIVYLSEGSLWAAPFDVEKLQVTGASFPALQGVMIDPYFSAAQVALSSDGSIAYLPGAVTQVQNTLVKVDRTGYEQQLTDVRRGYEDLTLSPDGRFLALTVMGDIWSVWLFDLEEETLRRVTFEGDNRDPIWTADSKRVIYGSFRGGHFGIYWKTISGSEPEEEMTTTLAEPWPTSCSKDGQWCAFDMALTTEQSGVFLLPLARERKTVVAVNDPFAQAAAISPDGKWIAYESAESGRSEIYVQHFPTGATKWQVSTDGGIRPTWAANGRELFFRKGSLRSESTLMSVGIRTEPSFTVGQQQQLFQFHYQQAGHDYAVMPDGQHFICIRESEREASTAQVNVILNWTAELKKR